MGDRPARRRAITARPTPFSPPRPPATTVRGDGLATASYGAARQGGNEQSEPVRLINGKPMWAANKRHSAEDNAEYQFNRDGADFGAKDLDDFVAKAHAFVEAPPAGVQTLTRANGDRLLYDPKANVFAVVSREGAPRTMFKPRDGAAYWDEQKQRLAEEANGSRSDRYGSRDQGGDHAGYSRPSSDDQG